MTISASAVNSGGPLALVLGIYLIIQNIPVGCIVARQFMVMQPPLLRVGSEMPAR